MNLIPSWSHAAACAGDLDPAWITNPRHLFGEQIARLTAVCRDCPVILNCDTWASHEPDFTGWAAARPWGGKDRVHR